MRGDLELAGSADWTGRGGVRLPPRAFQDPHLLSFSSGAAGTWKAADLGPSRLPHGWRRPGRGSYLLGAQERNVGVRTAGQQPGTTERRVPAERQDVAATGVDRCAVPRSASPRVQHVARAWIDGGAGPGGASVGRDGSPPMPVYGWRAVLLGSIVALVPTDSGVGQTPAAAARLDAESGSG